jgi:Flp pilus assembly protein TadG
VLNQMRSSSVTKSSRTLAPLRGQDGQISIFFSASLVVLITIVAFVINIGLFVKAKINLQNATDAAAFSGAAVQARQLTTIAHLNWEMRNIYKEWMFKYYVVGNLNVKDVEDPSSATNDTISFRLRPTTDVLNNITYNDPYNFPSVCIHLAGSQTNLC